MQYKTDYSARVIGVQGLRVVDASAFPLLPPGHPQASVCMESCSQSFEPYSLITYLDALAEKIADDILGTSTKNSSLSANYTATVLKFMGKQ